MYARLVVMGAMTDVKRTCRAAALYVSAEVMRQQGNEGQAKLRLANALKAAHTHLANHQLVAQVCTAALQTL